MTTLQKLVLVAVLAWAVFFAAVRVYADHTYSSVCAELPDLPCNAYCSSGNSITFGGGCPYPGNVTYGDHYNMFVLNNAQCLFSHSCEPPPDPNVGACLRDRRLELQEGVIYTNNTTQLFEFKLLMNPVQIANGTYRANMTIDLSDGVDWMRRSHEDCPDPCNDTHTVMVHPGYSFIFWIHQEPDGTPAGTVEHAYLCGMVDDTEEFTL